MTVALDSNWAEFLELLPEGGARSLNRSHANGSALDQAIRNGWTPIRVGAEIAAKIGPGLNDPAAFVASELRKIAALGHGPLGKDPAQGGAQPLHWTQPIPACGNCSGGSARWGDTAKDEAVHCYCWSPPPGYQRPVRACTACRKPTAVRTAQGDAMCPRCL